MKSKVLLVGLEYIGEPISGVDIVTKGLCNPEIEPSMAADALYEYDIIIINPKSYSHFLFGKAGRCSKSSEELWDLKKKNNDHDLDTIFDRNERSKELNTALRNGTFVIWLLVPDKRIHFFGWRSLYQGYLHAPLEKILSTTTVYPKKSRKFRVKETDNMFDLYFDHLKKDGWQTCFSKPDDDFSPLPENSKILAKSLEGHILCLEISDGKSKAWLMTAPCSNNGIGALVKSCIRTKNEEIIYSKYHGIFLSHTVTDKPFVRKLKKSLEKFGVKEIWIDDGELQVGDSLIKKIEQGVNKTKYVAVVLSPEAMKSNWVMKELEMAMNREISSGEVVILPLLYKKCTIPEFLKAKVYADFTEDTKYNDSLKKLLKRLRK